MEILFECRKDFYRNNQIKKFSDVFLLFLNSGLSKYCYHQLPKS